VQLFTRSPAEYVHTLAGATDDYQRWKDEMRSLAGASELLNRIKGELVSEMLDGGRKGDIEASIEYVDAASYVETATSCSSTTTIFALDDGRLTVVPQRLPFEHRDRALCNGLFGIEGVGSRQLAMHGAWQRRPLHATVEQLHRVPGRVGTEMRCWLRRTVPANPG
jgi:hypothetical protein